MKIGSCTAAIFLVFWFAAPAQAFFASSGNFFSPDKRWVIEWNNRGKRETIVLKNNVTGRTIFKLTPLPKFTVIKWNEASNRVAIAHAPDGVDPIFILFEHDVDAGWKQYSLPDGSRLPNAFPHPASKGLDALQKGEVDEITWSGNNTIVCRIYAPKIRYHETIDASGEPKVIGVTKRRPRPLAVASTTREWTKDGHYLVLKRNEDGWMLSEESYALTPTGKKVRDGNFTKFNIPGTEGITRVYKNGILTDTRDTVIFP